MTKEEAIKRIKDHIRVHHIGEYPHIKIGEALNMAMSALANDNDVGCKWIPVSERLPEQGQEVIIYTGNILKPSVLAYQFWNPQYDTWYHVTHWMPLPEPPK